MNDNREVAIIGAGVIGLGIGWQLARRGYPVTVFERDEPGSGASNAAAGMLAPLAELEFEETALFRLGMASLESYPEFIEALESETGQSVDHRDDGTLVVAVDRDDAEAVDHIQKYREQLDLDVERLSAEEARELEEGLAPSIHSAVLCHSDSQIDPRRLVDALTAAFENAGGTLVTGKRVVEVETSDGVRALRTADGERHETDLAVVCAGAWVNELEGLPSSVVPPIRPVRGQMIATTLGEPPLCRHVLRVPDPSQLDVYLVPKSDGRLLIGATSEERGFDPHLTAGGVFELLRGAWKALPGIYDQDILEMWTGFRPVTLDNEPVLGPTDVDGLWLAVGHGRAGILLAPVTARSIADAIETGQIPDVIKDFTPASKTR
mgnify:CR=1 FL=1